MFGKSRLDVRGAFHHTHVMKRRVQFAVPSAEPTDCELFPDPRRIFADWNEDLAARILPVAAFDLSRAGEGDAGPAVFLHYDDVEPDFLSWQTKEGLIIEIKDWQQIDPFQDPPDLAKIRAELGGYLRFEEYEIEIGEPSEYEESWGSVFSDLCNDLEIEDAMGRLRIGGGYPVYVQSTWGEPEDGPGFVAELPTAGYHLDPRYYYLHAFSEEGGVVSFQQIMMMT